MDYTTVAKRAEHVEVIRASRFIGLAAPIEDVQEAEALIGEARTLHPDANHHCWAWRFGPDMRFSDDGEPGGTAGRPMLEVLLRRELHNAAAVVTRYFGGTRLGAGGLVRAYSGTVAKTLDAAGTRLVIARGTLSATVPFALVDSMLRYLEQWDSLKTLASDYTADGLELLLSMPLGELDALAAGLRDHSRGEVEAERIES